MTLNGAGRLIAVGRLLSNAQLSGPTLSASRLGMDEKECRNHGRDSFRVGSGVERWVRERGCGLLFAKP
jgi:hypothetical protein